MPKLHPEVESYVASIPDGQAGTEATLAIMGRMVRDYKKQPEIIAVARGIVESVPPKAYAAESAAIFQYVQREVRYTQDVDGIEVVQTPDKTIMLAHGDCDDMAVLLATLLAAVGKKTRFVAGGFENGPIEHVWVEVLIGDRWFAMDPTETDWDFGDRPPGVTDVLIWTN